MSDQRITASHKALQTGWTSATVAEAWTRALNGPPHASARRGDRGPEFLDSRAREQLLHQLAGQSTTTGPSPVQHPSEHPREGEEER
jgi:hypothetical protein